MPVVDRHPAAVRPSLSPAQEQAAFRAGRLGQGVAALGAAAVLSGAMLAGVGGFEVRAGSTSDVVGGATAGGSALGVVLLVVGAPAWLGGLVLSVLRMRPVLGLSRSIGATALATPIVGLVMLLAALACLTIIGIVIPASDSGPQSDVQRAAAGVTAIGVLVIAAVAAALVGGPMTRIFAHVLRPGRERAGRSPGGEG